MDMRSFGSFTSTPIARLTTIIENSEETLFSTVQPSTRTHTVTATQDKKNYKKMPPKRSNSCCDFSDVHNASKVNHQPPSKAYLLRRSLSENSDVQSTNRVKTYADFLQIVENGDDSDSENRVSVTALKQGKEALDRWMKFFG